MLQMLLQCCGNAQRECGDVQQLEESHSQLESTRLAEMMHAKSMQTAPTPCNLSFKPDHAGVCSCVRQQQTFIKPVSLPARTLEM